MMPINAPPIIDLFGVPLWSIQLAISIAGLVIGSVIAAAGSFIAYRNAYGSAPLILVGGHSLKATGEMGVLWAKLDIVFWNNRKYPIRHTQMKVTFDEAVTLIEQHSDKNDLWTVDGNSVYWQADAVKVGPSSSIEHLLEVPFKNRPFEGMNSTVEIVVNYFDPISNKSKRIKRKYQYDMDSIYKKINRR